ncbi:MAG: bifunctional diaminohydroxyphosphoribosylaminopyrimidine deaminase/5-amino-6-(5-phosphoribosylamino)uracil reductase RibD [Chthoniobacterales bacterium]
MSEFDDEKFMHAALREAQHGVGLTSPNPAVGAVLVIGTQIVAAGYHRRAGAPHAEVECLRSFRSAIPKTATLYVTLEPCSTPGRTGACTECIIAAGVRNVVIGASDPNPRHAGRGIDILRKRGVNVRSGILANECTAVNEGFNKWIVSRLPFVIAKCGMSLDGRLTRPPGESQWLTSAAARRDARQLRASVDAILVGAETIRADNPRLTARVRGAKQPWRVVITRSNRLPAKARLFTDRNRDRTLVFDRSRLSKVLRELGERDITSVLIEGGGDVLGQALAERVIDKVQLYVAPLLTGGTVPAFRGTGVTSTAGATRLERVSYERIGGDIRITGYAKYAK